MDDGELEVGGWLKLEMKMKRKQILNQQVNMTRDALSRLYVHW